jgi:hypothetical protein
MSFAMTTAEREAFLGDVHVGIIAIAGGARGPLAVPIWYSYENGEIQVITDGDSQKGKLIARHRRFSLCAQTETAPYRYVSVEGPVTSIEPVDVERHLRPMARRYLGVAGGDRYVETTGGQAAREGTLTIRMRPERWLTVDYSKRG